METVCSWCGHEHFRVLARLVDGQIVPDENGPFLASCARCGHFAGEERSASAAGV